MSVVSKIIWGVVGLIAILISVFIVRTYSAAGQYTSLPTYGTQACKPFAAVRGVEDMTIDRQTGFLYMSARDRRRKNQRGDVFVVNLSENAPEGEITALSGGKPDVFAPVGLSHYSAEDGSKFLFVINRAEGRPSSVEIYKVENWKLNHVTSVSSPVFTTPNNIVAVGPAQFYLTNDGLGASGFVDTFFEFADQKPKGNVVYFDGKVAKQVADGFVSPNGIAASPDGKTIYVNDMHARTLKFFSRSENNNLTEVGDLFVGTGLDNIDVDSKGHLWIAAHPKIFDFYTVAREPNAISPSQVIEAVPGEKEGGKMRTVFLDKGKRLSGSSSGVRYKNKVLISGPYAEQVISCDIPAWTQDKPQKGKK